MRSQATARPPSAPAEPAPAILVVANEGGASYRALADALGLTNKAVCAGVNGARAKLAEFVALGMRTIVTVPFSCGLDPLEEADVTGLLRWASRQWPHVLFLQSERFAARDHVVGWASRHVHHVMSVECERAGPRTGVVVVGEGGSPAANAEASAISSLLWERLDCDFVEAACAHTGRATIARGIERCRRLGATQLIVVPLTVLEGPSLAGIKAQIAAARESDPRSPHAIVASALLTPAAAAGIVIRRRDDALARWVSAGVHGCISPHTHEEMGDGAGRKAADDLLPPRYRGAPVVSTASMRSAPLQYDAQGEIAWDRMWQRFCDLALAGGPPHRGTLLEPPLREEVVAQPEASARVATEIARGLSLVTRLPVTTDDIPGWVGLVCSDEDMAVWLLRAIVVENISVRRSGRTVFLPAGPGYRIDKEIKNVVTAVAKTHHYWTEHRTVR